MSETLHVEETIEDGNTVEATVAVHSSDARVRATATNGAEGDGLVLQTINQPNTTILDDNGIPLLSVALETLVERFDADTRGLVTSHATGDPVDPVDNYSEQTEPSPEEDQAEEVADQPEVPSYDDAVESYLADVDEATVEEMAEELGIDKSDVHYQLGLIDDERIEKRRDPQDGRRKLYSLTDGTEDEDDLWCGLCGFGPRKTTKPILSHHGEEHPEAEPMVLEVEPDLEDGDEYWCGVCGAGPFDEPIEVNDHHQDEHGEGRPSALEFEPAEEDLVEDVDQVEFRDWNGGETAADGGRSR